MELTALLERLAALAGDGELPEASIRAVLAALPEHAPADWRQLAAALAVLECEQAERDRCVRVLGISGGQGAGKSTLASLLVAGCAVLGRRAFSLSLDDFYLTRGERQVLAERVHPLLQTRGVPGTHDVELAAGVLDALTAGQAVEVPVFDKSIDDRSPLGVQVSEPLDLLIFEGWCVGARAEPEVRLDTPINELEREEDPQGRWRRSVNQALASDYEALWSRLDRLLYLKVPNLAAVIRWRTEQEQAHPADRRMSAAQIERFVAHYERLTRWMAESMVDQADLVGFLDENHRLADLAVR